MGNSAAAAGEDGWLPPPAEAAAYEGIRRGHESAFRAVAELLQPPLRRLAALNSDDPEEIDALLARAWEVALGGLDMFHWQTPFATWVAGLAVALGRAGPAAANPADPHGGDLHTEAAHPADAPGGDLPPGMLAGPDRARGAGSPSGIETAATAAVTGPPEWDDLPWGARWGRAWERLDATVTALPLPIREVIHTREVERWPPRRVCDVLGITEAGYHRLLTLGRSRLRDHFADLVAASPATGRLQRAQTEAVLRMLRESVDQRSGPLDARTIAVFQRWQAGRRRRWRLLPHRSLPAPR